MSIRCIFLCSNDRSGAFEIELSAIQALRRQLEDGVDRNNKLRTAMESQMKMPRDKPTEQNGVDTVGESSFY